MNFSNHYRQLSNEYLFLITMAWADLGTSALAQDGRILMSELCDLGNMMLMGGEINR